MIVCNYLCKYLQSLIKVNRTRSENYHQLLSGNFGYTAFGMSLASPGLLEGSFA
jgi:hypothetical protein